MDRVIDDPEGGVGGSIHGALRPGRTGADGGSVTESVNLWATAA